MTKTRSVMVKQSLEMLQNIIESRIMTRVLGVVGIVVTDEELVHIAKILSVGKARFSIWL